MPVSPAARLPPAGGLLLLLLLLPTAAAQVPPLPTVPDEASLTAEVLGVALASPLGLLQVDYNSMATTRLEIIDFSDDGATNPTGGFQARPHLVELRVRDADNISATGWLVEIGGTAFQMYGGQRQQVEVAFKTTPQITVDSVTATIEATLLDIQTQRTVNATINLTGEVNPYSRPMARMLKVAQQAGQFDVIRFQMLVQNDAVYPDVFAIETNIDKPGFVVITPPSVYVPGLESRVVNITVRTPYGKFYEFGNSATVAVRATSVYSGAAVPAIGTLRITGFYIPVYWVPLLLVGMVSAGVVARSSRERRELRRLEKGKPRRVEPTPRQAVMLTELKRKDADEYKAYRAKMAALYQSRRETYRAQRKEVVAKDREEQRQARLEYNEAKKRQKAERKAQRAQAKIDKKERERQATIDAKAAKVQRKLDKKQAKIDAKERKKLGKELEKKRKLLAKARDKAEKVAAREAKAEAKRAKAEARAAKKAAKSGKSPDDKP